MHTHTAYSFDCETDIAAQARAIRAASLDVVCATDHDTIEGALRLREQAEGFRVIVGEEITTRDGDLIGLFLERAVPPGLTAEETIGLIREQGGLVSVPHPFSRVRRHLRRDALDRLWPLVDCVEIFNGREPNTGDNRKAEVYASDKGLPGAVGSDAHHESEIGRAWIEVDDFAGKEGLVAALAGGSVRRRGKQSS